MVLIVAGVAAAAVISNAVIVLTCLRTIRGLRREFARREDTLIDKLCHLAGKPWIDAPATIVELEDEPEEPEFVHNPEQYADVWG